MIHLALEVWAFLFLAGIACYALYIAGCVAVYAWKPLAWIAGIALLAWVIASGNSAPTLLTHPQIIQWSSLPH